MAVATVQTKPMVVWRPVRGRGQHVYKLTINMTFSVKLTKTMWVPRSTIKYYENTASRKMKNYIVEYKEMTEGARKGQ